MSARVQPRRFDPVGRGGAADDGGGGYAYDEATVDALNVALVSGRPLIVGGPSGSGKSSLGLDVAYRLGWRYYQELLAGRTDPRDLCYTIVDAEGGQPSRLGAGAQVVPGVLWWAFDPVGAAAQLNASQPAGRTGTAAAPLERSDAPAVVLLDEVDAGPERLPDVLLSLLDQQRFTVPELGIIVSARERPLVILTTNERRPLATAALDRCVILILDSPTEEKLVRVGVAHFPAAPPALLERAADALIGVSHALERPVSARAYVSLVEAGVRLGVPPDHADAWAPLAREVGGALNPHGPSAPLRAAATGQPEGTRVFISYAREDAPMARRLHEDLARHGHAPWLDQEALLPGQNWRNAIERAMRESALFLALLSARSVSKSGYVQKEMREAIRLLEEMPPDAVYVVPVRLEPCDPPYGALHDLHWVDLYPSYEKGFTQIIRVIDLLPREMKAHVSR
jgi:MoxR-like ATPase